MRNVLGLIGWLLASFAAAAVGSRFMPGEWYAALTKPAWTPPNWLFAPVWTVLYVLMAVAAWLVWRRGGFAGAPTALALYIVQLMLNALWSYLFFGLHRPLIALIEIVALWLTILLVTALFWRVNRWAGAMLIPYAVWVGFASCLNFALWLLNPSATI